MIRSKLKKIRRKIQNVDKYLLINVVIIAVINSNTHDMVITTDRDSIGYPKDKSPQEHDL